MVLRRLLLRIARRQGVGGRNPKSPSKQFEQITLLVHQHGFKLSICFDRDVFLYNDRFCVGFGAIWHDLAMTQQIRGITPSPPDKPKHEQNHAESAITYDSHMIHI